LSLPLQRLTATTRTSPSTLRTLTMRWVRFLIKIKKCFFLLLRVDPEAIKRSALARKAKPKKTADYDSTEASTGGWLDSVTSFAKSWWS